jgi:hypothetical protein
LDLARAPVWEGVLEAVGEGFIQSEGQGHEPLLLNHARFEIEENLDALGGDSVAFAQALKQDYRELTKVIPCSEGDLIKVLMEVGDGADTVLAGTQGTARSGVDGAVGFQIQQAGDDLEVVLDPVMGLGEQELLAGQIDRRARQSISHLEHGRVRVGNSLWQTLSGRGGGFRDFMEGEVVPPAAKWLNFDPNGMAGASMREADEFGDGTWIFRPLAKVSVKAGGVGRAEVQMQRTSEGLLSG